MSRACKFAIDLPLDDPELSLEVEGNATPYDPGVTSGPPEACYPPEGGEVEIENVWLCHLGTTQPIRVEITPLLMLLDHATYAVFERLETLVQDKLTSEPFDEPDYCDYED